MLQIVAVLCVRALGTLGVQLWDPGRAVVCVALPDLGSVEGCGGDGLSARGEGVSAKNRASRMENLTLQMGREAAAAREEAEEDKRLLRTKNNLLKRTLGLVTTHQPAIAKAAMRSAGQASGSREEDPDARSRPPSAQRRR